MPVRQKTFRIERMSRASGGTAASSAAAPGSTGAVLQQHEVLAEIRALRDLIEQRTSPPVGSPEETAKSDQITIHDLNKLKYETDSIHRAITRTMRELADLHFGAFAGGEGGPASRELDAVADYTERATQQILEAAESIDEAANTLSALLNQEQDQALASDIRDHVVRIFEACNFQDISGQRIAKVLATLSFVEDRVSRMLEIWGGCEAIKDYTAAQTERGAEPKLVNGPKLSGDSGHVSQQEIDAMFA
ncbi:MAG TPA: protein phosphatase CheZ [Xanthobacteraceae bacterium]|jgi:chemotaxis protein CheZ|nr:protein phosphatase CheZ [Xanthobacteraceae bacterium]